MTLKEADEAAHQRLPVTYNDIEYKRISRTGYWYDEKGLRHGFVELYPTTGNSILFAEPKNVKLKEGIA